MDYHLVSYQGVEDFTDFANDLRVFLQLKENDDIRNEFPNTFNALTNGLDSALSSFEMGKSRCSKSRHEQFVVTCGYRAVGLCVITSQIDIPESVRPNTPNLSGFIVHPYRGKGIGRFSLEQRMKVVNEDFQGRAWTFIKNHNVTSEHLALSVGFRKFEDDAYEGRSLYLFGDSDA